MPRFGPAIFGKRLCLYLYMGEIRIPRAVRDLGLYFLIILYYWKTWESRRNPTTNMCRKLLNYVIIGSGNVPIWRATSSICLPVFRPFSLASCKNTMCCKMFPFICVVVWMNLDARVLFQSNSQFDL